MNGTITDATGAKPLLCIGKLHKSFGGVEALREFKLDVGAREIVGVIGPNGSGKSTLFNVITGVARADRGSIWWQPSREELVGKKPWRIFQLGVSRTFQNIRLCLGLSILDNVLVGLCADTATSWTEIMLGSARVTRRENDAREKALYALRFMGAHLAEAHERPVAELSYADRRRVEIARAIVSKPRLLLLDEPTAGMNVAETDEIRDEIRKINSTGVAVILIEHKMDFVSSLAGRIVVLNFGQKIAEGSYSDVRGNEGVIEAYLGKKRA